MCVYVHVRQSIVCVCERESEDRGETGGGVLEDWRKVSTLHYTGTSPHYSFKDIQSFALGVRG